jgi:hypothetical protein
MPMTVCPHCGTEIAYYGATCPNNCAERVKAIKHARLHNISGCGAFIMFAVAAAVLLAAWAWIKLVT